MTQEELMRPRYRLIADYPNAPFPVGTVLTRIPNATNDWFHDGVDEFQMIALADLIRCDKVFQPLKWWEARTMEHMPEYAQAIYSGCVLKIRPEDCHNGYVISSETGYEKWPLDGFYPATEAEYLAHQSKSTTP